MCLSHIEWEAAGALEGDKFTGKTGRSPLGKWKKHPKTLPAADLLSI